MPPSMPMEVKVGKSGWLLRNNKLVFDPSGDGDDDSQASTDTDHDYWTSDGQPTAYQKSHPIPDKPSASEVLAARSDAALRNMSRSRKRS